MQQIGTVTWRGLADVPVWEDDDYPGVVRVGDVDQVDGSTLANVENIIRWMAGRPLVKWSDGRPQRLVDRAAADTSYPRALVTHHPTFRSIG